eukprot:2261953-Karenia_brevis.AAC.1
MSKTARMRLRRTRQISAAQELELRLAKIGTLGHGLLGDASVTPEVLKDYLRRLAGFWEHTDEFSLPVDTPKDLDLALCHYSNHQFRNGELASEGEKMSCLLYTSDAADDM